MDKETMSMLVEQGGKVVSGIMHSMMIRPQRKAEFEPSPEVPQTQSKSTQTQYTKPRVLITNKPEINSTLPENEKADENLYRFECLAKHLGAASVLLKEAYERANDEGMGDGTAEKVVEAMNEHAGMEADLEKMGDASDVKAVVDKLYSGVRGFRAAAWKARLTVGGGTKDDIEAARTWNNIMLSTVYENAKAHPGATCVQSGM